MLTREQCRSADQFAISRLGIPGIVLMENAGRSCAEKLIGFRQSDFSGLGSPNPTSNFGVVVCCGGGNNGGDGFVIARHLYNANCPVKVLLCTPPEKIKGDAAINLRIIERLPIKIVELSSDWTDEKISHHLTTIGRNNACWIVDAILGTGASGELRQPLNRLVELINIAENEDGKLHRMAIDIPTGLDCDTGCVGSVAVRADITCTFIDQKVGFASADAAPFLGHVSVIGIGAPDFDPEARNEQIQHA